MYPNTNLLDYQTCAHTSAHFWLVFEAFNKAVLTASQLSLTRSRILDIGHGSQKLQIRRSLLSSLTTTFCLFVCSRNHQQCDINQPMTAFVSSNPIAESKVLLPEFDSHIPVVNAACPIATTDFCRHCSYHQEGIRYLRSPEDYSFETKF